jgi:hypothetical protein
MSRNYCCPSQSVLFVDTLLPMDVFMTTGDTAEMKLVSQIFDFVKSIAELELSEVALALFSAYVLLQDGKLAYSILLYFSVWSLCFIIFPHC